MTGEGKNRGARARALAAVLALAIGWTLVRHLEWTEPRAFGDEVAGIEVAGEARVVGLGQAREQARVRAATCLAREPPVEQGVLLAEGCPPRTRPLPLGARRTLGLPVDLNALTAAEFEELPGIGPTLAGRIVETRRRLGGFRSFEQLLEVPGIGPAKLEAMRAALTPERQ